MFNVFLCNFEMAQSKNRPSENQTQDETFRPHLRVAIVKYVRTKESGVLSIICVYAHDHIFLSFERGQETLGRFHP